MRARRSTGAGRFVDENHTDLRLQGSIQPCHGVGGVSSQFNLDCVLHHALAHLGVNGWKATSSEGICPAVGMTSEKALWAAICFKVSSAD